MRTDRRETDESRIRIKEQNKTLRRAEELARIYEQRFSSLSEEQSMAAQPRTTAAQVRKQKEYKNPMAVRSSSLQSPTPEQVGPKKARFSSPGGAPGQRFRMESPHSPSFPAEGAQASRDMPVKEQPASRSRARVELPDNGNRAAQQAVFVDQSARERSESAQLTGDHLKEKYKKFLTPEAYAQHEKRLRQLSLIFLGLILVALLLSVFFGRDISRGLRRLWSPGTEKGSALAGQYPAEQTPSGQVPADVSPEGGLSQGSGGEGSLASAAQAPGEGVKAGQVSAETTLHGDKVGSHPAMTQAARPFTFSTEGQNLEQPLKGIKADAFRSNSRVAAAPFSMKEDFEGLERSRDEARIKENLRIMAQKDVRAQLILDQWEAFPPTLRFLAGNNPMALGVCVEMAEGKAWPYVQENGPTFELGRKAPLYLQWDRRWAAQPYADGCIANSACAPTALSMVMSAFTGKMVTPSDIVAQVRPEEVSANGTEWSFLDRVGEVYGVSSERLPYSEYAVRERLAQGKIVVILVGEGYFTFVGHMLVILDVDEEGFTINDPNSYENSLRKWSFEEIAPVQEIWAFGKKPDA